MKWGSDLQDEIDDKAIFGRKTVSFQERRSAQDNSRMINVIALTQFAFSPGIVFLKISIYSAVDLDFRLVISATNSRFKINEVLEKNINGNTRPRS